MTSREEICIGMKRQFNLEHTESENSLWQYSNDHNAPASGSSVEVVCRRKISNWMDCLPSKEANLIKEVINISQKVPLRYSGGSEMGGDPLVRLIYKSNVCANVLRGVIGQPSVRLRNNQTGGMF